MHLITLQKDSQKSKSYLLAGDQASRLSRSNPFSSSRTSALPIVFNEDLVANGSNYASHNMIILEE